MKTILPQSGLLLMLVVLIGITWWERQPLQDWWKLRGYTPPAAVTQLADEDTMNAYTRHLFYLNKPQLPATVNDFRKHCPENQDTIVLGCYHPDQNGIYIYNVQDQSLAGIQQVTAAHEVLHAVYARLSGSARIRLNSELESYFRSGLADPTVKAEVALYQKTEPNSVYDEMSCTFGTEIAQLPAGLSAYYAQFFTNRQKIVSYEDQYKSQFTTRQQEINATDAHLFNMKQEINSQETSLTAESNSLDSQKTQLERQLSSGDVAAYNTAVAAYNIQVDNYNAALAALKQDIGSYNQLVNTRNTVAGQLTTLDSAIDTRLTTAPGQ
jgi:hypothetical protein